MQYCDKCGAPLLDQSIFDTNRRSIWWEGEERHLGGLAWSVLECLAKRYPKIVHKEVLIEYMWHGGKYPDSYWKAVDVHVSRARYALRGTGYGIENVYKRGYRIVAGDANADGRGDYRPKHIRLLERREKRLIAQCG